MDADVKTEVKIKIKTEPVEIMTSLKEEAAEGDDDEYVVPPKRLRRNQGTCCAIIREIQLVSMRIVLQKYQWLEIALSLILSTGWLF